MKTVFLKRVAILVIAVVTISVSAVAQPKKGDMDAGVNLLFGSSSGWSNAGLGAKFRYNVIDPIRLVGEFDYFLKKDYVSFWDFSVYGQYLFPVAEKIVVYPEVGLGVLGSTVSIPTVTVPGYGSYGGSTSGSDFAFTLGGGADYELTPTLTLNGELRIKLVTGSMFNIVVGLAYKF
jgi:outer membrane protein X